MKNMCEYPLVFDDRNLQSAGVLDYQSDGRGLALPRIGTSASGTRPINSSFTTAGGEKALGKGPQIIRQADALD